LIRSGLAGITLEANRSSFIAYATSPDTVAFDGTGLHSPFTQGVLEHIRTPNISISDMMIEVRNSVIKATNHRQRPWDQSSMQERFFFKIPDAEARPTHTEPRLTQTEAQQGHKLSDEGVLNAIALEHWRAIKGVADPRKLRAFLAQFGAAKGSWLARDRLEELEAAAWSRLPEKRTADALRAFLADYPDGINARTATAELTELLAASQKAHKGTLAEAEPDPQQGEPKSIQPPQVRAALIDRMYAHRREVAIAAGVAVFVLTYLIWVWPQHAPTDPVTPQPPALANTDAPATAASVTELSPTQSKIVEQALTNIEEIRNKSKSQQQGASAANRAAPQTSKLETSTITNKQTPPVSTTGSFTIRSGTEATGVADGVAAYVSSIGECEQKCARSATCKVFAYGKKARSCYLYMRADFSPNADFDSGVRK
jgi:hypothetical protein